MNGPAVTLRSFVQSAGAEVGRRLDAWRAAPRALRRDMLTVALEEAMAQPGCPVCRLASASEARSISSYLWEGCMDVGIRERIWAARGFCHRHAWRAAAIERARWSEATACATVHTGLVECLVKALGEARRGSRRALANAVTPTARCLFCQSEREAVMRYSGRLARELAAAPFRARLLPTNGLCLPHAREVLRAAPNAEIARFVARQLRARLAAVHTQFEEARETPDDPAVAQAALVGAVSLLAGDRAWSPRECARW